MITKRVPDILRRCKTRASLKALSRAAIWVRQPAPPPAHPIEMGWPPLVRPRAGAPAEAIRSQCGRAGHGPSLPSEVVPGFPVAPSCAASLKRTANANQRCLPGRPARRLSRHATRGNRGWDAHAVGKTSP